MSLNTSHTVDGRGGILLYNGEMILIYSKTVNLEFGKTLAPAFRGKKVGHLYLTSHRIIFLNEDRLDALQSLSMPFLCLRDVKLEQPVFGANFLKGSVIAQPNGNLEGELFWKMTFNKGGCIEFGQSLLKAASIATVNRPFNAPPPYAPPAGAYFSPPPSYYIPQGGLYSGFQAPVHAFPDQPQPSDVYMYEEPPPYPGIPAAGPPVGGGQSAPFPAGMAVSAPPPYPVIPNKQ